MVKNSCNLGENYSYILTFIGTSISKSFSTAKENAHVLDTLEKHNPTYQNMVMLEYMFYFLLIFQSLYEENQYEDLLFQQLHHLSSNTSLKTPCAAGC